jgi:hypothetical protein
MKGRRRTYYAECWMFLLQPARSGGVNITGWSVDQQSDRERVERVTSGSPAFSRASHPRGETWYAHDNRQTLSGARYQRFFNIRFKPLNWAYIFLDIITK